MEMGTHDPVRNLPEGWVTLPGGGIVPAKLDRPTGWQADRDTVNTAEAIKARKAMAKAVTAYHVAHGHMLADGADLVAAMVSVISKADAVAEAWHRFAEATGGADA